MANTEKVDLLNKSALEALSKNEVYQAQCILRKNAKINPGFVTYNNLGAFYIFEGLMRPDNMGRWAGSLGKSYLLKAEKFQKSNLTLLALGRANYLASKFKEASEQFLQACELKLDYASAYNSGLSLYQQDNYYAASQCFSQSIDLSDKSNYYDALAAYAFSVLHVDKNKCYSLAQQIAKVEGMEHETFELAFMCGDNELAASQIKLLFSHYSLHINEMAMIFDCLHKLKRIDDASKYLSWQVERLEGFEYNTKPEISRTRRAFKLSEYRNEIIASYRFTRPLIKQCCYAGCEVHNNK